VYPLHLGYLFIIKRDQ